MFWSPKIQPSGVSPGAPVFVGKSPRYTSKVDKLGINLSLSGHNALQSTFVFNA
jgi:hypothetical protein